LSLCCSDCAIDEISESRRHLPVPSLDHSASQQLTHSNFVVNQIYAMATLSRRETAVLRLLGDGKTTLEIAAKLKITMKTVQEYCRRLRQKLHAANRNRLIRIAVLSRAGVAEIVSRGVREE
jgi:DNA-binding NarL/FixJ family response regulator